MGEEFCTTLLDDIATYEDIYDHIEHSYEDEKAELRRITEAYRKFRLD